MKLFYKVFILILLSLGITGLAKVYSQGEIRGNVIELSSQEVMSYVTVSVLSNVDSSIVSGGITNDLGAFNIQGIDYGAYLVKVSFIGFKSYWTNVELSKKNSMSDLGVIELSTEMLDGVEITVDKPAVTYEIDKKVVNVENMDNVAAGTAVDVLANIPSVTVDVDGNVTLRGSAGFTLLIDNRLANMPVSEALQMIPASNIKDIEIITNPSAQYDAEGTAGIINIILKKNKLEGFSTLINASVGTFNNYNADFLTSINKKKYKINIGGNYRKANRYRDIYQERITEIDGVNSVVEGAGEHRFFRDNYGVNGALEWAASKNDFISVSTDINQRQYNAASNYFFTEKLGDSLVASYENRERTLRDFFGLTASVAYMRTFKENKKHFLNIDAMYNLYDGVEDALAEYYDNNENFQGGNQNFEVGPSALLRFNVNYELPFKNKSTFKTGARLDLGNSSDDQDALEYSSVAGEYVNLPLFTTDVSYTQNVAAAYLMYGGKLKEKLGYQFGIRAEYTDRLITQTNSTDQTVINRLDWFPSAHFSYALKNTDQLNASISRRIERPRSWHLEPFIAWEDPFTVRQGNPDLLPEYIISAELGWIKNLKKGMVSAEAYYRNTTNIRQRIQEVYDTNVIIKRPINAGVAQTGGLELGFRNRWKKWWSTDIGVNLFYYQVDGEINGESLFQEAFTYNARVGNSFNLKHDFKIQLVARYESDRVDIQGVRKGFTTVDLSIRKDFLKKKLSATLQYSNILNTEIRENIVETASLYTYRRATPFYPVINLTLSYRINNFKNQDKIDTIKGDSF